MDQMHLLGLFRNASNKAQQIGFIGVGGITGHRMNMRVDFHFSPLIDHFECCAQVYLLLESRPKSGQFAYPAAAPLNNP